MMSKTEQLVVSAGAMLRSVRGQRCPPEAGYGHSFNAVTQAFHTPCSSGETGAIDKRRSYDNDG